MERTKILCVECFKAKLLKTNDTEMYCDNCGTEFILNANGSYKYK